MCYVVETFSFAFSSPATMAIVRPATISELVTSQNNACCLLQLMDILSDESTQEVISWLPHGTGFQIHKKKTFANGKWFFVHRLKAPHDSLSSLPYHKIAHSSTYKQIFSRTISRHPSSLLLLES
jgi:HSF-type DNA-binding